MCPILHSVSWQFLKSPTCPVSGETISNELGITRSAVWKHINELRMMGYDISSSQKEGYRLTRMSNKLLPYEIHKNLHTKVIGKKMRYLENTPSTIWAGKHSVRKVTWKKCMAW